MEAFDRHLSLTLDRLHYALAMLNGKTGKRAQRVRARLKKRLRKLEKQIP